MAHGLWWPLADGDTDVPRHVREWARQRQAYRDQRDFPAADVLRERIAEAGFDVVDAPDGPVLTRAQRYHAVVPEQVPDHTDLGDASDLSVLLLLDAFGLGGAPGWLVDDAARCLASVLRHCGNRAYEVVVLDNGVGGDAGDWAADAARNPGITAVHLREPVGFASARSLQHQVATGRVLLWLDTGVELTGDAATPLLEAFADPAVGAAGRWGADLGSSVHHFDAVEPPDAGVRDVAAVWGYLLALRRDLVRSGRAEPDPAFAFYRNADADVSFRVREAGARTVVCSLPVVQHVHRGYSETPADLVERESRRNYRRLLDRWRPQMERLAGA